MAVYIPIVSEFNSKGIDRAVKEFKSLEKASDKANFVIQKAAVPATAALTAFGAAAFKAAQKASDLGEETNKASVIFGDASADVIKFSKDAASTLGQSQTAALKAAGTFGVLGKAAGLSGKELGTFATEFTTLASDLASFNNTSPEEAVLAIGAALRGEAEPIRRYGVLLNDATLKNKALELGLIKTTKGALDPQTKSLAAQAVILEQTKDAQGDFARTSDGLANSQRILKARLEDATTQLGLAFLPILEKIVPALSKMAGWASQNAELIGAVTVALAAFASVIVAARVALGLWRAVSVITTGVNYALATSFTAVQVATGIGIATALAGAAAFVIIKKKMDAAKDSATAYSAALPTLIKNQQDLNNYVGPVATRDFNKFNQVATGTIPTVEDLTKKTGNAAKAIAKLKDAVKDAKDALRDEMAKALDGAKSKLDEAQRAFDDFARNVASSISQAFSFKDAYEAGKETGKGFISALSDEAAKIKNFSVLVNRLLAAGLSERALQRVLDAGVDAGTAIAEELLNSATGVIEANRLTQEVEAAADQVGLNAANKFYKAGVTLGATIVKGIQDAIAAAEIRLKAPNLTVNDVANIGETFRGATGVSPAATDLSNIFPNGMADFLTGFDVGGIGTFAFAEGGIVTKPVLGLVGEAGPEAIIPLDRLSSMGGNQVIINVNGGDPEAVVNALRRYMQVNGSVPIRVSA